MFLCHETKYWRQNSLSSWSLNNMQAFAVLTKTLRLVHQIGGSWWFFKYFHHVHSLCWDHSGRGDSSPPFVWSQEGNPMELGAIRTRMKESLAVLNLVVVTDTVGLAKDVIVRSVGTCIDTAWESTVYPLFLILCQSFSAFSRPRGRQTPMVLERLGQGSTSVIGFEGPAVSQSVFRYVKVEKFKTVASYIFWT